MSGISVDMLKYIVEALGTFFFVSVILDTLTDSSLGPIAVAIALLSSIYFGSKISGGHFNPAVSIAMFLKDKMTMNLMIGYIIAQLIGAGAAVKFNNLVLKTITRT